MSELKWLQVWLLRIYMYISSLVFVKLVYKNPIRFQPVLSNLVPDQTRPSFCIISHLVYRNIKTNILTHSALVLNSGLAKLGLVWSSLV